MTKVPKNKLADSVAGAPKPDDGDFQFSAEQVESSWFHRAVSAGLRYTKSRSESSGMKVLPVLDLDDPSAPSLPSFKPQLATPKGQPAIPTLQKPLATKTAPSKTANRKSAPAPARTASAPEPKVDPAAKPAFGPPERTMFRTAINQFFVTEEKKRTAPVKRHMQPNMTMMASEGDSAATTMKLVIAGALVLGIAFGVYRIFSKGSFSGVAARLRAGQVVDNEDPLRESEAVIAPRKSKVKIKGSGKLRRPDK